MNTKLHLRMAAGLIGAVMPVGSVLADQPHAEPRHERLPDAVAHALEERFDRALIDGVDADVELGLLVYEVDLYQDGREIGVEALPDGTILTIATETRLALLPATVLEALPQRLRGSRADVDRIEVLHGFGDGPTPRVVYHVRHHDQHWLVNEAGQAPGAGADRRDRPEGNALGDRGQDGRGAEDRPAEPTHRIADVRRGQTVVLRGEVQRIQDEDEFVLRDESGTIEVYIGWKNDMPLRVGQTVTVHGVADDDAFPGRRPDVYARRLVLPDGETIQLRGEND